MNNLQEYVIKYLTEITNLFIEMAPYLMLGFLISGILYIFVSKDKISNHKVIEINL